MIIQQRGAYIWKSGDLRENQFENVSPDITSMYDFNVVSNEDEQSFSFNYKNQNQQGTWGNVYIVATQVNRPLPKQIIVTAITMMEDVKGGNSQSVGIMVTQLELKSSFPWKNPDMYYIPNPKFSFSDCKASCWSNCSCVAFYFLYENATGCKFWTNMSSYYPGE